MVEDDIKIYCLTHGMRHVTPRTANIVVCNDDPANPILSEDFPKTGKWLYCCDCQHYWNASQAAENFERQCPACGASENPRYYTCDQCNVTMMDFSGSYIQRDYRIMPWGQPHPSCPGCGGLPSTIPQTHRCPALRGLLTTARAECMFCESDKGPNSNGRGPNSSALNRGGQSSSRYPFNDSPAGRGVQSETELVPQNFASLENAAHQIEAPSRIDAEPTLHPPDQDLDSPSSTEAQSNGALARSQAMAEENKKESASRLPLETRPETRETDLGRESGSPLKADLSQMEEPLKRLQSLGNINRVEGLDVAIAQIGEEMMARLSEATRRLEMEQQARRDAEKARKDAVAKTHELQAIIQKTDDQYLAEIARLKVDAETAVNDALAAASQAQKRAENADARVTEIENRLRAGEDQTRKAETSVRQEAVQRVLAESRASELEVEFNQKMGIMRTEFESEIARLTREASDREESLQQQSRNEIAAVKTAAQTRLDAEITARIELEKSSKENEKKLQVELINARTEADAKLKASESRAADFAAKAREWESRTQTAEAVITETQAKAVQAEQSYKTAIAKIRSDAQSIVKRIEDETFQIKEVYKAEIRRIENEIRQATDSAIQAEQAYKAELAQTQAQAEALAQQVETNHRAEFSKLRSDFELKLAAAQTQTLEQEQKYKSELAEAKSIAENNARQSEERRINELAKLQTEADAEVAAAQTETRETETRYQKELAQLRADFELKLGAALVETRQTEERAKNEIAQLRADAEKKQQEALEHLRRTEATHEKELAEIRANAESKAAKTEERHRWEVSALTAESESKLNATNAEKIRLQETAKAEFDAAQALAANEARLTDERYQAQIASLQLESESKLQAAAAERQRMEMSAKAELDAARIMAETNARLIEENHRAEITALTQQADAKLNAAFSDKQRSEENARAELTAAQALAESNARQAEEKRKTEIAALTAGYESKLKIAHEETGRIAVEIEALRTRNENEVRRLSANHQAELSKVKAEADSRVQLTLSEAWRAEEIYKSELEQVRLDAETEAQAARKRFQTEIDQLKAGLELKLQEAAAENLRIQESAKAEVEAIRREDKDRIQEAEARAYQAMNETQRTETRLQAKIEEANARAQGALLASETSEKRAAEAEARARLLEDQLAEVDARRQQAELGLAVRSESGALVDTRASAFELEFNRNLELVRARIAKAQTDAGGEEIPDEPPVNSTPIQLAPIQPAPIQLAPIQPVENRSKSESLARNTDERYRTKLAEVENKFREMETRIREAENRSNRSEEAFKNLGNNLIAEVELDADDILSLDEDLEKKFEVSELRARAKYQTLPLIAEDAKNKLSNDTLQDIDEDPLGDLGAFSVVDRRDQNIEAMRRQLASEPYNQQVKAKLNKLLIHQGISLACNNRQDRAVELLLEASNIDPANELVWLWLASMADSQSKAISYLQRAIEINPSDEKARAWLENLLLQPQPTVTSVQCPLCGSILPAEKDRCTACKSILTLNDIDAVIDNMEVDRKILFTAIERYQGASIASNDYGAHFHLGLAYLNLHQMTEAVKHFQIVSNLCPEDEILKARVEELKHRQRASVAASEKNRHSMNRSKTVMIIDDSAADRKLISGVLERYGHRIVTASGSMEALAKLNDETPDLIFLDISMPGMDGYQLCSFIKSADATRNVPVIMLSGDGKLSDEARGRTVGADGFITKPFEPTDLIETLDAFCNTNPGRRQLSASF